MIKFQKQCLEELRRCSESLACSMTLRSNNLSVLLQFIEVCRYLFTRSSFNARQVEAWTLVGTLKHFDSFLFQPFFYRFGDVLGIAVMLYDQFCQAFD